MDYKKLEKQATKKMIEAQAKADQYNAAHKFEFANNYLSAVKRHKADILYYQKMQKKG